MINPFVRDYFKNKRIEKNFKLDTGDKIIDGGVNVIGHINSEFGLGHTSRCFIDAIQKAEIPMNIIEKKLNNKNTSNYCKTYNKCDYSVNIHSYNPSTENSNFKELFKNRYNIGIWFFELETLPENWKKLSENYDEIWATTSFLEDVFKKELLGKKVRRINHPLPSVSKLDKNESKSYFEINRDEFVCLFIFDFHSDFYRKNPLAVIETFQKTFKNEKVRLIIKSHSGTTEQVNLINQKIKSDSRITHYSENWPSKDINILMNACDVYISLHRSEGLGLTLLESIALEKPTLCTNYSGNLDFCKPEWSELVDYEMIDVDKNSWLKSLFNQGKILKWANPKVEEASLKLRKIHDNYSDYEKRAKKGSQWILENYNIDKISKEVKRIFDSKFDYKWEEFIDICSDLIQYLPKQFPIVDKSSKKKSLIVECRKLKHNEFVIKNTIQKLGDGWGHIIYCHENNHKQIKSICDEISPDIEIRLVEKDLDRNDYNNLLLDINFWNEIDCEKVLIYQTDTFIAKKFDDSFLEFDYIGAPWGPSSHSNFLKNHLNLEFDLLIGNGGLSIRNVEKSKSCLIDGYFANNRNNRTDLTLDELPEDIIFSLYFYDKKYPSLQRSIDFSCETSHNLDSFGFHKPWNIFNDTYSMTKELKKKFFQKEKKRILFINHEESLTGAPILLKNLIDFEIQLGEFDIWVVSLRTGNSEWNFKQKIYLSDIPGDSDSEKGKYLQEILNPDFVYANTIVTMSFAKNFICDKLISIHEYRSLIPYLSNLKEDLLNFDRIIVACEPAQKLLKSIDLDSICVPYYLNLKSIPRVLNNVSEGLIVGAGYVQLRKGLQRFIEIAKKMPNKKFVWIGCIDGIEMNGGSIKIEGPNFLLSDFQIGSEIKKITFVLDLPSNVEFLGLKSEKETFEIISNSECFLMLSSDDPFPLVAIDAKLSNTRVVNLKESGDSYKVCNIEDLVLENYDCDKIVQYLENISNNKKYLNLNLTNQIENNLSVNRKQYLSFLNRKMKVFLAIDSNSEKFSYELLKKSISSLRKFDYEIKVVTDKMTDYLLDVSELCEIIIFDSEITKHIRGHFENYKQVAGSYYTLEISKICIERNYTDKFVVYCDYDIICNRKFDYLLPFYTEYLAASPEWEKQNSTYFNTGIVLFNVKNTFSRYEIIKNLVLNNEFLEFHDQSILNEVFKGYFTQLDNRMNWKPYWGITTDFHIIHYHWLKPHMDMESKDIVQKIKKIGNNIIDYDSVRYYIEYWKNKKYI